MSFRTWVYSQLTKPNTPLEALIGDRVFAKKSMTSGVEDTPFIVFKLGYNASEGISETLTAQRQFLQIFVHDYADETSGDYLKIDSIIQELKKLFQNASSPDDGVLSVWYLETSQDLGDDTLSTVMKYIRFQAALVDTPLLIGEGLGP